jgi:hypothetical protein
MSTAPSSSSAAPVRRLSSSDALLVELAGEELLGHEVHPVLQRRDEAHVGRAVDPGQLRRRHVAVLEHDGLPVVVPMRALISRAVSSTSCSSAWYDASSLRDGVATSSTVTQPQQVGRLVEHLRDRLQPLGDPLGVVDTVDAHARHRPRPEYRRRSPSAASAASRASPS